MPDEAAAPADLLKLMSWLSPAFPVGAFAYSHGLERAIHDELIHDRASLANWMTDLIERGSGWNDAVLLAEAWRMSDIDNGASVAKLAEAMAGTRERHMETTLQGEAFGQAVGAWANIERSHSTLPPSVLSEISPTRGETGSFNCGVRPAISLMSESQAAGVISPLVGEMSDRTEGGNVVRLASHQNLPYPVAVGLAAARHNIPIQPALLAYLHAFASNLIQASVRLVPLGQRDGVATLAALEPTILAVASRAATSTLDDLGSCTFMSDIMSMKHEIQYSRVFRS